MKRARPPIPPAAPALAVGLGLVASPVHAALDPGTGTYAFQTTATVAVAAGFALKVYGPRLRAFLSRRRRPGASDVGPVGQRVGRGALIRGLAVLAPPVLVLSSAHELFLRNQQELGRTISVLYPLWTAAGAAAVVGLLLARAPERPAARLALAAYYAAGLGFMVWGFLRALPLGAHLVRWLLDSDAGVGVFVIALAGGTLFTFRHVAPRSLEPLFAVLAVVLLTREAIVFGARLDRSPLPPPRDVVAEVGEAHDSRLPNVYHLLLDSFQDELFSSHLPPGADDVLTGFVRFRATSRSHATSVALPAIFSGRWQASMTGRAQEALVGEGSLLSNLREAGFRTLAVVPRHVYKAHPSAFDVIVFHDLNVPEPDARALHAAAFLRLWMFRTLPLAASERLARGALLGFGSEFFQMKGVERVATFTKPLVSRLSLEGWLQMEPRLPPRGRYTLVHVALPHVPFRLRSDCSNASAQTDLGQQTDCTLSLLTRTLELLRRLDRLDDAVVLVHGDHGAGLVFRDGHFVEDESAWYRTLLLTKSAGARGPLRQARETARLEDIAPTLLAMLGITRELPFEGHVLAEALVSASGLPGPEPRVRATPGAGLTATGPVGTMPNTRGP